jgi:tetratricopeptide (TPR) repeat protein
MIKSAIEGFVQTFPFEPSARYYHGLYLLRSGNTQSAKEEFRFAATKRMDIVSEYDLSEIYSAALPYGYQPQKIRGKSFYQLGLIYAQKSDIDSAFYFFKQATQNIPDDPDSRANLALVYDQKGNYQMAESEFLKAISLDSTKTLYYYNYALTLGKMGRYHQAENMLTKAVLLKPDFIQAKQKLETLRQYLNNTPPINK